MQVNTCHSGTLEVRDISNISPSLLPCLGQGLICCHICQVRSMCFQGFSCLCLHRSSTDRNLSPHAYEASTLCTSHLPGSNLPFFSFLSHSMSEEVKGQFTRVNSLLTTMWISGIKLRSSQAWQQVTLPNWAIACPKFCLFYKPCLLGCLKMAHAP